MAERGRGAVLELRCADCGQPATRSLGTLPLCDQHHWEAVEAILARRPDLRAPGAGYGQPTYGWKPGDDIRCSQCKATWVGPPGETCWWCERRAERDVEIQQSLDSCRLRDYLTHIRDGSQDAIAAAARLLKVAIPRGTLTRQDMWRFQKAIGEAESA